MRYTQVIPCEMCDAEIKDGAQYHAIIGGSIRRFCSSACRQHYRRDILALMVQANREKRDEHA